MVTLNAGAAGRVVIQADQAGYSTYAPASEQTSFTVGNGAGSVWIVNGDGSVSEYDLNGNLLTAPTGSDGAAVGTVPSPQGAAFDATGNLWLVDANGVNFYTSNGTPGFAAPLTAGGIANALQIAAIITPESENLSGEAVVRLALATLREDSLIEGLLTEELADVFRRTMLLQGGVALMIPAIANIATPKSRASLLRLPQLQCRRCKPAAPSRPDAGPAAKPTQTPTKLF